MRLDLPHTHIHTHRQNENFSVACVLTLFRFFGIGFVYSVFSFTSSSIPSTLDFLAHTQEDKTVALNFRIPSLFFENLIFVGGFGL